MPWSLSVYATGAGESPDCTIDGCRALAKHHVTARSSAGEVKYGRLCDHHLAEARAKCGVPAGPVVAPAAEPELPAAPAPAAPAPRKPPMYAIPEGAKPTTCSSCGESIVWVLTPNMRRCPVEAFGEHRGETHFAHCEHASQHSRKTRKRA